MMQLKNGFLIPTQKCSDFLLSRLLLFFFCHLLIIINTNQLGMMFTGKGNGSRAAEDSVAAEERQKGSGEEKVTGSRSENGCQSSTRPHMSCLQGESVHFYWLHIRHSFTQYTLNTHSHSTRLTLAISCLICFLTSYNISYS